MILENNDLNFHKNLFWKYITSGDIKNLNDLKKYYRILATHLHPDKRKDIKSNEYFVRLKNDYETAKLHLNEAVPAKEPITRKMVYEKFFEIEASGFPVDIAVRNKSKVYLERLVTLNEMLKEYKVLGDFNFNDIENEMYKIRGDNIIDNKLFGVIRMIFYNIVTWHLGPKRFTKMSLEKWFQEIEEQLKSLNYQATYTFLEWLISDLENGSAFDNK